MHKDILTYIILPNVGKESKKITSKEYTYYANRLLFFEFVISKIDSVYYAIKIEGIWGRTTRNKVRHLYKDLRFINCSPIALCQTGRPILYLDKNELYERIIERAIYSDIYIIVRKTGKSPIDVLHNKKTKDSWISDCYEFERKNPVDFFNHGLIRRSQGTNVIYLYENKKSRTFNLDKYPNKKTIISSLEEAVKKIKRKVSKSLKKLGKNDFFHNFLF